MILARKRFSEEGRHTLSVEPAGQLCLKIAFVKLIRFQHQVIWSLKKLGAQTSISLGQMSTSHCCLCKCLCYVAYIICQCNTQPVCLNHVREIRECNCGSIRTVFVRKDFMKMVAVAQRFEQDEGILNEALTELPVRDNTEIDDFESEEGLLSCVDFAEYVPYCHLVLEERTSLNKNSNGESSSSCEPLVHIKRQSKSSLSSGVGGDVHAKESSTAPKQGTIMQSLKKLHGKVYRNLERQYAVESKEEKFNLLRTPDGLHVLLISDILSVMKAEVSSSEILNKWKSKALSKGLDLKAYHVDIKSVSELNKVEANDRWGLSVKGCMQLPKLLEEHEVNLLHKLVEKTFGKLNCSTNASGPALKSTKVNGRKGEKRDFEMMNKTADVNTHKISGGKNSANFSEISLKKLAHGGRSKKRDFDTMNKIADVTIHKILGGKDSASLSEVSLKKPAYGGKGKKIDFDAMNKIDDVKTHKTSGGKDSASLSESLKKPFSELKMRTTFVDRSVKRKPQEEKAPGDRQVKNVNYNFMETSSSSAVSQRHRSVRRRIFQHSKEAKEGSDDQSEEKEHLNLCVKNENVKSHETDNEASKKAIPLSEENLQGTPFTANVAAESGKVSGLKVRNRENLTAAKNGVMQEKHAVAILEQGADRRSSSVQENDPLKHEQLEHAVTSAKGIKTRERESTMQCCRKPSSRKPNIKLSNEPEVHSENQRENGKAKRPFPNAISSDNFMNTERKSSPQISRLKIKGPSPPTFSGGISLLDNNSHEIDTDCGIMAVGDSLTEGLNSSVPKRNKDKEGEICHHPQNAGENGKVNMQKQMNMEKDKGEEEEAIYLMNIDIPRADFNSEEGMTDVPISALENSNKDMYSAKKEQLKEKSLLYLEGENHQVRSTGENPGTAKSTGVANNAIRHRSSDLGNTLKFSDHYSSVVKGGRHSSSSGVSNGFSAMSPEFRVSSDFGCGSGMLNDRHSISKQEFLSKTKDSGSGCVNGSAVKQGEFPRSIDNERTVSKLSREKNSPELWSKSISRHTLANSTLPGKPPSSTHKVLLERDQSLQRQGDNLLRQSGHEYDQLTLEKQSHRIGLDHANSSQFKGCYEDRSQEVKLCSFRNKWRDVASTSPKECPSPESIAETYLPERQVLNTCTADGHDKFRSTGYEGYESFCRDPGARQPIEATKEFCSSWKNTGAGAQSYLGFENKNSSFMLHSPHASSADYSEETKAAKIMPADENSFPVQPDLKYKLCQKEDSPKSVSRKGQKMNYNHWTDMSICQMSPFGSQVGSHSSRDNNVSTVSREKWPSHQKWVVNEIKDNGICKSETPVNLHPDLHSKYSIDHSAQWCDPGADQEFVVENFALSDHGKESQAPTDFHQGNALWADTRAPLLEEEMEFSIDKQPTNRSWQCHNKMSATVDLESQQMYTSEHGYWPSFVNTPRKQEHLARQKLLIEKWGRA